MKISLQLLACVLPLISSNWALARTFKCTAEKDGVIHTLQLDLLKTKVQGFTYRSITTDSSQSTCEISASRYSADGSGWRTEGPGLQVDVPLESAGRTVTETVSLTTKSSVIRLQVLGQRVHDAECGMRGFLEKSISLKQGSSICLFDR